MGQVYQATDTKLNREVALKIFPEGFSADPHPKNILVPIFHSRPAAGISTPSFRILNQRGLTMACVLCGRVGGELLLSPQSVEIIKFGDPGSGR